MPFLVLFIVVPLLELAVLIKIGGYIGVTWTLVIIFVTAIIGVNILKKQGMGVLMRASQKMQEGTLPARELAEGFLLALSGALLLTPGFLTDAVGFALLAPVVRLALVGHVLKLIKPRVVVAGGGFATRSAAEQSSPFADRPEPGSHRPEVIEGEYRRED
ncbi:FxsA family protein [Oceanobacter antarcticus]|uniref:FxsA family protein n=1 Tax=Oceanobacter antarcticus TaxID=3133425 RepID=A0ABW8NDN9_9GAMM